MIVLDASALLAFLQNESGQDRVAAVLDRAVMSAANVAEVWGKVVDAGKDPAHDRALLDGLGVRVEPVTADDALWTARLRAREVAVRRPVLSLADRCCLALGARLGVPVLTADRAWTEIDLDVEVQLIR